MERNALNQLIKWNNNSKKKPLIVWGARQVGKTYLIKNIFAEKYYKNNYIYIDLKIEKSISSYCYENTDPKQIIEYISLVKEKKINKNTLLIFDEVQECPNVVSSLKYFCQDFSEIPIIVTGSMVRIKILRETKKRGVTNNEFLFPVGKINQITMYPMTFDEFLLNTNNILYEKIKKSYENNIQLEESIHEIAIDYVYKYLLIGGMPEVVECYIENNSIYDAIEILKELYDNYLSDMELYQASPEAILRSRKLFQNIFKELNKKSKNFSPSLIEKNSRIRDYYTSLEWLRLAHIINISYQLKEHITLPLLPDEESLFRIFLGDIGMFSYQSGLNAASFISNERENTLTGIFFENFVANELIAKGMKLCYWKGKNTSELEFIIESNNKLYPLDVKKGKGCLNSLMNFANHNKYEYAIKISKKHFGYNAEQKILTIPFYYVSFISNDLANNNMKTYTK